jgi:hypothetical protein
MKISKKIFFLFILSFFPYSLSAWGGTEKLSDGSCKFDLDTGYKSSSVYIKNNESFVIIDGGDSRYGTISTVYNTLTCEEVTSGEKVESDFSGLMERKGFKEVELINKSIIDKSFQNKITILESSDNLTVHIEPIDSSVTQELKTLLVSLSDKSVSSHINISSSAKEFLSYREFYALFSKKINNLSATEINFNYALALNSKLQNDLKVETTLLSNFFDLSVKSIKDIPQWTNSMIKFGKQNIISNFRAKIMKLSDFGKSLNLNNFLSSIEYKYIFKNMKLKKAGKIRQYGDKYGIYLEYPDKTINLTSKPTCKTTGQTSTSEFSCGFFWANTCVGTYEEYSCTGDTSKIAQIEQHILGTTKIANTLSKGWKYDHMISRYTKSSSSSSSSYDEDLKNLCLANNNSDYKSSCYSINNEDLKNLCLANNHSDYKSSCYSINNENLKNLCLANNNSDYRSSCYSIK